MHTRESSGASTRESREPGTERSRQPTVTLIRVMPAKGGSSRLPGSAVIGGGVIGLSVARPRSPGRAGPSACIGPNHPGVGWWRRACVSALHSEGWPVFGSGLAEVVARRVSRRLCPRAPSLTGSLVVAFDRADAAHSEHHRGLSEQGHPVLHTLLCPAISNWLSPRRTAFWLRRSLPSTIGRWSVRAGGPFLSGSVCRWAAP